MTRVERLLEEYRENKPRHQAYCVSIGEAIEIIDNGRNGPLEITNAAIGVGFALGRRYALNEAKKERARA